MVVSKILSLCVVVGEEVLEVVDRVTPANIEEAVVDLGELLLCDDAVVPDGVLLLCEDAVVPNGVSAVECGEGRTMGVDLEDGVSELSEVNRSIVRLIVDVGNAVVLVCLSVGCGGLRGFTVQLRLDWDHWLPIHLMRFEVPAFRTYPLVQL